MVCGSQTTPKSQTTNQSIRQCTRYKRRLEQHPDKEKGDGPLKIYQVEIRGVLITRFFDLSLLQSINLVKNLLKGLFVGYSVEITFPDVGIV